MSRDGGAYHVLGSVHFERHSFDRIPHAVDAAMPLQTPGELRYVRVTARNVGVCPAWHPGAGGKAWMFSDEIVIE